MANGDTKTPTWQWIAGIAISALMFLSNIILLTALSDIRESKVVDSKMDVRVTSIEDTNKLQFDTIKEWRDEIRLSLSQIAKNQTFNARNFTDKQDSIIKEQKNAAKVKEKSRIVIFEK